MSNLQRIAALLAMAERTENEHEAAAFLAKAQALAAGASIDLAMARAAAQQRDQREVPTAKTIAIGELRKHANKHLVELFLAIAAANDLKCDIARNSTYVIAYGMPSDIEVAELLFNSLAVQMAAAGDRWVRSGNWRGDSYSVGVRRGRRVSFVQREHTGRTARGAFYAGFTSRIGGRLSDARQQAVAERSAYFDANPAALLSTAVVLRAKADEVADFHERTSEASGSWAGYSGAGAGGGGGASRAAGRLAAEAARLGDAGELHAGD